MVTDMTKGNLSTTIIKFTLPMLIGNLFQQFYNIADSIIVGRFIGKDALAAVVNVGLDLLFVIVFNMGVNGVALATVIAQGLSSILCALYIFKKIDFIRISRKDMVFDKHIMKEVGRFSILTSMQQSIMTFGMVCVQGIVNTFGANTIAAFTAASKIDSIAYLPVQDFGNGFATYIAQNKGAKKYDRISQGVKSSVKTIIVFCALLSVLIYANSHNLMRIFVNKGETEVIKLGIEYLSVISIFYVLIGFLFMFYGYFRGIGALNVSLFLTIISLGIRVLMAYILSGIPSIAQKGIWWSVPIGWIIADLIALLIYKKSKKDIEKI